MARISSKLRTTLERMGEQTTAIDRLYTLLDQLLQFNEANSPLLSAIAHAAGSERRPTQYESPFYQWLHQVVVLLLQRAREREEINFVDLAYGADLVLLPLSIDFYRYQRQRPSFSPERIAAGLHQFLLYELNAS